MRRMGSLACGVVRALRRTGSESACRLIASWRLVRRSGQRGSQSSAMTSPKTLRPRSCEQDESEPRFGNRTLMRNAQCTGRDDTVGFKDEAPICGPCAV